MAYLNNRRSLIQRHRGKLLLSIAGITALFTTGSVVIYMIKKWLYRQQLRFAEQHFIKEQMKRRFIQTQEDSLHTLYELVPVFALVLNSNDLDLEDLFISLRDKKLNKDKLQKQSEISVSEDGIDSEALVSSIDMENSVLQLKPEKTKAELWNELKDKSLIKLVTLVYSVSSLFLLTRLQLNMLTRREYLSSAIQLAVEKENERLQQSFFLVNWVNDWWTGSTESSIDGLTTKKPKIDNVTYTNEQAFLSLSWWLLNHGWLKYEKLAHSAIIDEFQSINPRDTMTLTQFSARLSNVFQRINKEILLQKDDLTKTENSEHTLMSILLPDESLQTFVLQQTLDSDALAVLNENDSVLRRLIHETSKYVESNASGIVMEELINESFQFVMGQVEEKVKRKKKVADMEDVDNVEYQMALLSIALKDCCSEMTKKQNGSQNNKYLGTLDSLNILDDLSASVYSNFDF